MAENKKAVVVYADWISTFDKLSDQEAGRLIKYFFKYINDMNPEAPDRLTELLFEPIKSTLRRDLRKYEEIRQKRSDAGRQGGRPTIQEKQTKAKKANALFDKQTKAKKAVSVSDSVSVSVLNIPPNPPMGESEVSTSEVSDFENSVFEIWNNYSGKRNSFEKDLRNFCKKTEGVENIDFEKLKRGAVSGENKNIYFQSWLNDIFPNKTRGAGFDLSFVDVAYKSIVKDFIEYRKQIKKPFKTEKGVRMFYSELLELSNNNLQKAKQLTDYAKGKEWQTVYKIKSENGNKKSGGLATDEEQREFLEAVASGIARAECG